MDDPGGDDVVVDVPADVPEDPGTPEPEPDIPPDSPTDPGGDDTIDVLELPPIDVPDEGPEVVETNACGGTAALDAVPGEPCGACGAITVCDGPDTTLCLDFGLENACGGCAPLAGGVGDPCGPCLDGQLACNGEVLACFGADELNECGGCEALVASIGEACTVDDVAGAYLCVSKNDVACIPEGANACGGTLSLPSAPGTPCGACGLGSYICDGDNSVACDDEDAGVNACGGCNALTGSLGAACGVCQGGTLACGDDPNILSCVEDTTNACGGCDPLEGTPGEGCEDGVWVCTPAGVVACDPLATNACGGTGALAGAPGDPCGECGDGALGCADLESLACLGASALNACGQCGALVGTPGDFCGPPGWTLECGDAGLECTLSDPGALVAVYLQPAALNLAIDETGTLTLVGTLAGGGETDLSGDAVWSSADESVATVESGAVTGVGEGQTTVTASYQGWEASATISVSPPVLESIAIAPETTDISLGDTASLTATATYSDGSTVDVTESATWSSDDEGVATVAGGEVSSVGEGAATITATLDGISGSATVNVLPPVIVGIAVDPASSTIFVGDTTQLTATATYSDGSSADVTGAAAWTSSDTGVATVDTGAVEGVGAGLATISAEVDGVVGTAEVIVQLAGVVSIAVSPASATVVAGLTQSFTAEATLEDGSTADVTSSVTWLSSDEGVAIAAAGGTYTGVSAGAVTVTAQIDDVSGTASLTVTPPEVVSVEVAPSSLVLAAGETATLTATATYTDGSTADVTDSAVWTTDALGVASVVSGLVTAEDAGDATITATLDGASASASVTVTPAIVVQVDIVPASTTIFVGASATLAAIATYSDGATADVTSTATWGSSDEGAATVDAGVVDGLAGGVVTITATFDGVSGAAEVTVQEATVVTITVSPDTQSVAAGLTVAYTAEASFDDGSTADVTAAATWTVSDPGVAMAMPAGQIQGLSAGTVTVTAQIEDVSGTATLEVTPAEVVDVTVAPSNLDIPRGDTGNLTATATYTDLSVVDVTATATWTSSDEATATVAAGVVTAVEIGVATVSADVDGVSGAAQVTVLPPTTLSLSLDGLDPLEIGYEARVRYTATADFSDGTSEEVDATWTVSDPTLLAVEADGWLRVLLPGTSTATASYDGFEVTVTITGTAEAERGIGRPDVFASPPEPVRPIGRPDVFASPPEPVRSIGRPDVFASPPEPVRGIGRGDVFASPPEPVRGIGRVDVSATPAP